MGSMSFGHWLVVLVIVVLIFGTRRLTSGAKDLGGAVREFKKGLHGDEAQRPPAQLPDETYREAPRSEVPREPTANPGDRDPR